MTSAASAVLATTPALPSYYGPRSFCIPLSSPVTASLLQDQSARARQSFLAQREAEARDAVGKTGRAYLKPREERIRARLEREKVTSVFAAASHKIQATHQAAASSAEAALKSSEDGNEATKTVNESSYFSGDHLLAPIMQGRSMDEEEKQSSSPTANNGSQTSRTTRQPSRQPTASGSGSQTARASTAHSSQPLLLPKWNSTHARERDAATIVRDHIQAVYASANSDSTSIPTHINVHQSSVRADPNHVSHTASHQRWNRRVEKLMARGGIAAGGPMEQDLLAAEQEAKERAWQERQQQRRQEQEQLQLEQESYNYQMRPQPSSSRGQHVDLFRDQPPSASPSHMMHGGEEQDEFHDDLMKMNFDQPLHRHTGHQSLFSSPIPPMRSSPTPSLFGSTSFASLNNAVLTQYQPSSHDQIDEETSYQQFEQPPSSLSRMQQHQPALSSLPLPASLSANHSSLSFTQPPQPSTRPTYYQPQQSYANNVNAPAATTLAPHFLQPLQTYTQQWWVRLHNSENHQNTSPYYIGNKSVYYLTKEAREKKHAEEKKLLQQQLKEWEEQVAKVTKEDAKATTTSHEEKQQPPTTSSTSTLPPLTANSSSLKKLIVSSDLITSPRTSTSAPSRTTIGGFDRPSSIVSPRKPPSSKLPATPESDLPTAHGQTTTVALPSKVLSNLPSSWSTQPTLVRWSRGPAQMTRRTELPVKPQAVREAEEKLRAQMTPYERELEEMLRVKSINKKRGTKFQYDLVSELHGFLSQKNIKQLLKQTNYNRRELYVIYVRFKALCALSPTPHGIDKHTFKKGVARLAVEDDRFVNRVFSLVDDDGSGQIEWEEFLTAMSALEKGDPEAKTRFFFQIYDLDADGYISRQDLSTMFHSSSMLDDDETTAEVVTTFVNKVFHQFGAEESGKISFEDVMTYMKSSEGEREDVWDIFGRSMLQEETLRGGGRNLRPTMTAGY